MRYRSDQIGLFAEEIIMIRDHAVSVTSLTTIFDVKRRSIQRNLSHGPEDPTMPGGNPGLDDGFESAVLASGWELFRAGTSMTRKELLEMVQKYHDSRLTKGRVNAFIGRLGDDIKVCHPSQQEDRRLIIPHEYSQAHITLMSARITGKFSQRVFNVQGVRCSPWEDRKRRKVIGPLTISAGDVFHSVSPEYGRVTPRICVSTA
jgi:hypothetical protein